MALAKKEAMGDFSHLKNKKGQFVQQPLPQPTLPNISIDDELSDIASLHKRVGTPSTHHTGMGDRYYATDAKASYDHPMPAYNAPSAHSQDPTAYTQYNSSVSIPDEGQYYEDDYGSTAHLALAAETHGPDRHNYSEHYHGSQGYVVDPHNVYTGHAANGQYEHESGRYLYNPSHDVGIAFDTSGYTDHRTGNQRGHSPGNSRYDAGQFHAV
jgi:hypothetical protein